jgi:hypothetical protein
VAAAIMDLLLKLRPSNKHFSHEKLALFDVGISGKKNEM